MACASAEPVPLTAPPTTGDIAASTRIVARAVRASDSLLMVFATQDARDIAQAGVPLDASGLIGRNREWGAMYAARFQLGTGAAFRVALTLMPVADAPTARAALTGIEAGLQGMDTEGRLAARLPLSVSMGREAAPIDIASGAAFYLGDACLGLLSLEAAPERDAIATSERRGVLRARLVQSIRRLTSQSTVLLNGDRRAPNRLLFDARAYLACGTLADDNSIRSVADAFIAEWQRSVAVGGWFLEDDGWDTSYQAVSLDIGTDVATLMPTAVRTALFADLTRGAGWLAARVLPDGRVESAGNTRTCGGGESFLGTPKSLAMTSVVIGLAKVAVVGTATVNASLLDASRRVSGWARRNAGVDPCFAGIQ